MTVKLKVEELNYGYGHQQVLDQINLALNQGEFIGLIGPNGSGKSTLLKNINNILVPQSGTVYLEEQQLKKLEDREVARKLALVPQNTEVNFKFTVHEIVMMGRTPYINRFKGETEEDYQVTKWAMKLTNTWQFKDRLFNQLSGGEQQRVILARSLAQQPEVFLLDEPTASLDINYQLEIMNLLTKLNHERELTILVVLHDLNLAAEYCQKLILLNQGEIYDFGQPQEVITAQNIEEVYGSQVEVKTHYPSGRPYIAYKSDRQLPTDQVDRRVHLISGGGAGRRLLESLVKLGCQVSCGVVNVQDSDWELARELGVELVTECPFAQISPEQHQANLEQIAASETVILADIPFGRGNLLNLKAALWAVEQGKEVIVVANRDIEVRDYTAGKAQQLYHKLVEQNVEVVTEELAAIDKIK